MKKFLLTLIVSLAFSGLTFAQYESHWKDFNDANYEMTDYIVAFVKIDGNFISITDNWADLEVASYVNGEVRGHAFMDDYTEDGVPYPSFELMLCYDLNATGQVASFKLFDHGTQTEYDFGTCNYEITTGGDEHYEIYNFDFDNATVFSFTTPAPGQTVPWGDEWTQEPGSGDDVTIGNDIVIIGNGVVAYANSIDITGSGQIIIEEGGQLFHNDNVLVTMELEVAGYTAKENPAGYKLIAPSTYTSTTTPYSIFPSEVTNLIPTSMDDMDLYYFDGSQTGEEWRNFKYTANNFTKLFLEKGYLYANVGGADLEFAGNTVPTTARDITLDFNAAAPLGAWNLIGNPFTCNASVDREFYVLNPTTNELDATTAGELVLPMQGFFVKATATGDQVTLTPTTTTKAGASLNITVSQANAMVDNAILSFNAGSGLEKFQLNPNHTKVYMPVEGKDYAVVSADNQGEMPVNFKAETNGTYSLDFSSKNTEFSYLHLIDNMTGNDVDLLATPSYSFDARNTDYASRFKLVYATGNAEDSFAFISNGEIILSGVNGNTTVQVFDVTGRMLNSTNAANRISTENMAAGVYMLRLINGDNVMTQKIVVK